MANNTSPAVAESNKYYLLRANTLRARVDHSERDALEETDRPIIGKGDTSGSANVSQRVGTYLSKVSVFRRSPKIRVRSVLR